MDKKYGKWKAEQVCIKCNTSLTDLDVYENSGICPDCGHSNDSCLHGVTEYRKVVYRDVYNCVKRTWWIFKWTAWTYSHREYIKDGKNYVGVRENDN